MTKDDAFLNHEVAFLPVENEVHFFASLQNLARFSRHPSKDGPQTLKSSIKTSMIPLRKSEKIVVIHLWNVTGAL